jgi:hypothetical protein
MIHKAKKLDARYNGSGFFKYMVDVEKSIIPSHAQSGASYIQTKVWRGLAYIELRFWAWETWGESCELNLYRFLDRDYPWSWDSEQGRMRFYLKGDKELSWFLLKWNK